MLISLYHYIKKERTVSVQQLVREFHIDFAALQPMLSLWEKKGVIQKHQSLAACKSTCFKCREPLEYYQYVADKS